MKRFLTPQERKLLRYEKGRRNAYGESRASSRKSIAARKAKANRALRHAENIATDMAAARLDDDHGLTRKNRKTTWRKFPDTPLADYVGRRMQSRVLRGMNPALSVSGLLLKARRHLVPRPVVHKGPLQNDID